MTEDNVVALEPPGRPKGANGKALDRKQLNRPPAGKSWIWLTLEMMKSDAWWTTGNHGRRIIDFLLIQFLEHGGRNNGQILAPYAQLEDRGIGRRFIADALANLERIGLIDCHRGGMRVVTTYTLNWLPLHDGTPPSDRWRAFRNPKLKPWAKRPKQKRS
jgi:hypothetical protein